MRRNHLFASDLEAQILKRVRASGGISRVELARTLGLAPSTAGIYVERLLRLGFLAQSDREVRGAGRPPVLLHLNPAGGEFVGIDFEARNINAVAVDFADKPLRHAQAKLEPQDSADDVVRKLEQTIAKVVPRAEGRLLAIGVGVPGLVDAGQGVAIHYKYIPKWKNVPLAERLRGKFGVPVYLENNVRSMALAELWFGQGLGHGNFLCVGIRSGIGAGMVLDGRLYSGAHHDAGEFGRWRFPALSPRLASWFASDDPPSPAGPELQDVASVRAIQRALERALLAGRKSLLQGTPTPIPLPDLARALQQRDTLATAIIEEAASHLGRAIGQLCLAIDPGQIILAGPLTLLGDAFLRPMRTAAETVSTLAGTRPPQIVASTLGEFSAALGAAALAVHEWKPEHPPARSA